MRTPERPAGLPEDLGPEALQQWSNDLVAFLGSDRVPDAFRGWADAQAAHVDAWLAAAGDLDDADDGSRVAATSPARGPARGRRADGAERPARAPAERRQANPGGLLATGGAGKLLIGIAIGVIVLAGIAFLRGSGGSGAALPNTAPTPAFNQARADELARLLQQNPANKDALFELGEMNFQAGRNAEAIASFTKLVALDPANGHAMRDIGTANFNLGRADEAKTWWLKALKVDPNDVQAHYNMGFAYANAQPKDLAAAVKEWETVIRLDPTSQLAQTARVHVDGLKAQLTATPAAGSTPGPATPAAPVAPKATP
ncbi:MAG: tetratricopeptide repeat protein [Chloroflexota bacterium]|nr:tetratricopeptide repeat protein [Chloroflexota bacterium]